MTSSISWTDPSSLAGTLKRIGVTTTRPEAQRAAPAPLMRSVQVEVLEVPATPAPEPKVPAFVPAEGALRERLVSFIDWLTAASDSRVAFLVDHDGLPLVDRQADPDLIAVASSVMQLVDTINGRLLFPLGRTVTLELEKDLLLLMTVETAIGKYIVGQVVNAPLPVKLLDAIGDALREAFKPTAEEDSPAVH